MTAYMINQIHAMQVQSPLNGINIFIMCIHQKENNSKNCMSPDPLAALSAGGMATPGYLRCSLNPPYPEYALTKVNVESK